MKNYNILINKIMLIPIPNNINYLWNNGSILMTCLMTQFMSGFLLIFYYSPSINNSFNSIMYLMRETNYGFIIRFIHMNMASMFFLFMYLHISRNLLYQSFKLSKIWYSGVTMLILSTLTAFLGYTLPWGQMSYWGAIVITNLVTSIPIVGQNLLNLIWGNFSMNNTTLMRFFNFHYMLPFIIIILMITHIAMLHNSSSNNPLGLKQNNDMIYFNHYFSWKDYLGILLMFMMLMFINFMFPYLLMNKENFFESNPMITPIHIEPEWYFLYAYAMLRSIPNKLSGTIALMSSILILYFVPLMNNNIMKFKTMKFYPINKFMTILFFINFIMLTIMGSMPMTKSHMFMTKMLMIYYFSFFFINPLIIYLSTNL
uniref:cytochrome b n=1 Tax=Dipterophagus daci TaxID=2800156 RepID=UPI001D122356|nr:cytochrome b [Dipterophagus daci]QZO77423.1 cytochrome b [Dipterophagus daci]